MRILLPRVAFRITHQPKVGIYEAMATAREAQFDAAESLYWCALFLGEPWKLGGPEVAEGRMHGNRPRTLTIASAGREPKPRRVRAITGRLVMDTPETNRTLVAEAFARLSAEDRAFVRRAYYYGWTTAQIGADLGVAEGTVKTRLHHALRALQQTLQEMGVAP
jgi:hypothetical protein